MMINNNNTTLEMCVSNVTYDRLFHISNSVWHVVGFFGVLFGIPGHILQIIISLNKTSRKEPTSLYSIAISVVETVFLLGLFWLWCVKMSFIKTDPREVLSCGIFYSIIVGSGSLSHLYLASLSIDRSIIILDPTRYRLIVTRSHVILRILLITFIITVLLIPHHFYFHYVPRVTIFLCDFNPSLYYRRIRIWTFIHAILLVGIPSLIVCICSAILLHNRCKHKRTYKNNLSVNARRMHRHSILLFVFSLARSFNQPKFCPTAEWNPYGITFANETTLGEDAASLFINTNNTVYTVNNDKKEILTWINNSISPNKITSDKLGESFSIFVTNNGDIYYDNGEENGRVDKWISNTDTFVNVMNINSSCFGIFIDSNDTLYCSMNDDHKVIKRWLNDSEMISTTAAGTGIQGSDSNELQDPMGIFVDLNLDLYVADCGNHRIQLFKSGELNGTTLAGEGSSNNTISLTCPSGIVLDADKYLFIVDQHNHRIIRSGPNDIRCIIGCYWVGSESHQLSFPMSPSFDSYGNVFIIDKSNHRIQKFDFLLSSCDNSSSVQSVYSSVLTENHPTYSPTGCDVPNYYYEAIQMNVNESRYYTLNINSTNDTLGYIYAGNFYPSGPYINLIPESDKRFVELQFPMRPFLRSTTANKLVVTTYSPNVTGTFSIIVSGFNNVTFKRLINPDKCIIGGSCNSQTKGIGITLDDILRYEIKRNMTLKNQPLLVRISVALTMIMLIMGLINSILSLLTFQNADLRKVGCGIYLLASSITSFLTISMFTINFWFILLTQTNSSINLSVRRGGCISIEPILKLFLYFDTWLNACVAIERAINVYQGISFNKEKSKRLARWIIFILPFCIIATIIHEPLHRNIFEYPVQEKDTFGEPKIIEIHRWCVINYSSAVQDYNTAILFIHLIGPFIANLFSALFIIFGTARQRSLAQTNQNYIAHIREQLREHKQLVISPAILLVLSMPRLIISLLSGCVKVSDKPWLYLLAYFISFTPSILVFVVFVVPSELYLKTLKESLKTWQRRICH
ncbi:unnamed protein product [Adineta steineri]|uniref:G-protein coupled receptors family 1 profile domain-containing protein n=2 Tax=Adineta steineri TaxID=433720 RepID=A0A813PP84_9BILA|nr:unnamed protein product [Adineta steineri]